MSHFYTHNLMYKKKKNFKHTFFSFRRLLQMGVYNCQLYNNLGLCCFYAQQYDMTLSSFERALSLVANDEEQADVWYNIGHVAVVSYSSNTLTRFPKMTVLLCFYALSELCVLYLQGIGDVTLAYQCFKLALTFNNDHAEAYNNLAVLELRKGRVEQVRIICSLIMQFYSNCLVSSLLMVASLMQSKALLQTAASLAPHMYEPHFNLCILSEKVII